MIAIIAENHWVVSLILVTPNKLWGENQESNKVRHIERGGKLESTCQYELSKWWEV